MEIPSGLIADALGRRRILIASFLVYIVSFIGFSFSNNFLLFAFSMSVFAFADAFRTGVHKAMIFQYLELNNWQAYKVDYYGNTRSWSQSGSAISAALAAIIVYISGNYQLIFMAAIIPYLLDAIIIWSYPKYLDGKKKSFNTKSIITEFKEVGLSFKKSFSSFKIFRVLLNLTLYSGYYKSVKDYIQPIIKVMALAAPIFAWMTDERKTAVLIGVFYFITYFLTAIASKHSGEFNKLFKRASKPMNLTILIGLLIGLLIGVFFIYGLFLASVVGFVIIMIIENLRKPIGIALIVEESENKAMASVLSVESQVKSIIAAILAPTIGLLADIYNPGIALIVISFSLLLMWGVYKLKSE